MSCRKNRKMFVDALYDELRGDQLKRFNDHLRTCSKCAEAYQAFQKTQDILNQRMQAQPDEPFWTGYINRLVGIFEKETRKAKKPKRLWTPRFTFFSPSRMWILGPTVAVGLVILGIWIGRMSLNQPQIHPLSEKHLSNKKLSNMQTVAINDRAQRYLGRSKILLLGLVNFDPKTDDVSMLNLDQQQRISQELVQEAAYLKDELDEPGQKQLRSLVADLEVILMQIANLESKSDLPAVEMVKTGVNSRGILFKIQLEEMLNVQHEDSKISKNNKKTAI